MIKKRNAISELEKWIEKDPVAAYGYYHILLDSGEIRWADLPDKLKKIISCAEERIEQGIDKLITEDTEHFVVPLRDAESDYLTTRVYDRVTAYVASMLKVYPNIALATTKLHALNNMLAHTIPYTADINKAAIFFGDKPIEDIILEHKRNSHLAGFEIIDTQEKTMPITFYRKDDRVLLVKITGSEDSLNRNNDLLEDGLSCKMKILGNEDNSLRVLNIDPRPFVYINKTRVLPGEIVLLPLNEPDNNIMLRRRYEDERLRFESLLRAHTTDNSYDPEKFQPQLYLPNS